MAHLIACLDCRLQSGGASTGWVMPGDGVPLRHGSRRHIHALDMPGDTIHPHRSGGACASGYAGRYDSSGTTRRRSCFGYAGRYDSSGTTTGGAFVLRGMPSGTIHPAQQPAARSCFGACQAVRFINTTRGTFAWVMPDGTIHPAQQAAARRIALIHRAACQSRCTSHILLLKSRMNTCAQRATLRAAL